VPGLLPYLSSEINALHTPWPTSKEPKERRHGEAHPLVKLSRHHRWRDWEPSRWRKRGLQCKRSEGKTGKQGKQSYLKTDLPSLKKQRILIQMKICSRQARKGDYTSGGSAGDTGKLKKNFFSNQGDYYFEILWTLHYGIIGRLFKKNGFRGNRGKNQKFMPKKKDIIPS